MPGYLILPDEAYDWSGDQPTKVRPHPTRLGLFDLIRALEQDPFPFDRRSQGICLTGLDELLVTMNQLEDPIETRDWPELTKIHRRLRAVSNEVSNMPTIHVPIRHQLVLGAGNHLFAHYAGKRVPLWRLFGCNPSFDTVAGLRTYRFGDNLS